ncbi:MAG TPA: HD domain-containing protein [Thermoanaerobaculia bacterium]|nr:HD domain-containing protein [Thermoanaerobaculia bacterium]
MQTANLLRALEFASERHSQQRRKGPSGVPYVNHPIEVASLLAGLAEVEDADILIAAVLHDVLEDTETTPEEVAARFGERVLHLVGELSDDKSQPLAVRRQLVLEHLESAEVAVKLIKLADLCSNIQSVPVDWTNERLREYLDWSARAAALCHGASPALDRLYDERASRARASSAETLVKSSTQP